MEQIRKGNDIKVYWEIITGGDGSEIPYELEGKALELYVQNAYEKVRISDFVANGNVIEWTFYGKDQKTAGVYSLTLIENNGSEGMRTVDECNAFELVTHSCKAGGNAESRVSIETVRLRSVMTLSDVVPDKELNKNSTNVVENGAIAREFEKQNGAIAKKQDIIPDLARIREGASKGATALQEHQDISGKANTSGRYPEMSVGFADDLVGRGESVPAEFSFRASGGKSIKDGTARIKRLKGNSVVWNNKRNIITSLDNYGYACYNNGNKVVLKNVSASTPDFGNMGIIGGFLPIAGHKYVLLTDSTLNLSISSTNGFVLAANSIGSAPSLNYTMMCIRTEVAPSIAVGASVEFNLVIVDLTLMFGAGNEPTTIEEYNARKPIVADEFAYNEGEVIHMTAEDIKSIGDNAWDEQWEKGFIDTSTGEERDFENFIRGKNFNRIIGGQDYYLVGNNFNIVLYDENYQWIDFWGALGEPRMVHIDDRARYFKISFEIDYGTTYKNDAFVSLYHSGWKAEDAKYQPYWEDRLMFDKRIKDEFPDGMSKWDMVYNKNGKGYIVKGMRVVEDMSKMDWERNIDGRFQTSIIGALLPPSTDMVGNIMCNRYTTNSADDTYLGLIGISLDSYGYVWVRDDAYTDAASLKESLQGIPLYYQLAEPTIIEYDEPFNLDYRVADFGTEEIIASQPSAPISADIIYQFNAVDMIREHELEITELQRIIATMQAQLTSLTSNNGGQ